jgi:hypothetical protein
MFHATPSALSPLSPRGYCSIYAGSISKHVDGYGASGTGSKYTFRNPFPCSTPTTVPMYITKRQHYDIDTHIDNTGLPSRALLRLPLSLSYPGWRPRHPHTARISLRYDASRLTVLSHCLRLYQVLPLSRSATCRTKILSCGYPDTSAATLIVSPDCAWLRCKVMRTLAERQTSAVRLTSRPLV